MGRTLRLILFVLFAPLLFFFGLLGWMSRRREEDDDDKADIVEVAPDDESEDERRRWFLDLSATGRVEQIDAWHNQEAAKIVPNEPFDVWAEKRRIARLGSG